MRDRFRSLITQQAFPFYIRIATHDETGSYSMNMMRFLLLNTLCAICWADVLAQEVQGLSVCAAIENDRDRLVCFDELAEKSVATDTTSLAVETIESSNPNEKSETVSVPSPQSEQLNARNLGAERLPDTRPAFQDSKLTVNVIAVTEGNFGHLYFHLDGGAVWRQNESRYLSYPQATPFSVEISRGMMGDYQLRIEGKGRRIRVIRVE